MTGITLNLLLYVKNGNHVNRIGLSSREYVMLAHKNVVHKTYCDVDTHC